MPERTAGRRLDQPSGPGRRWRFDIDVEAFGRVAERLARFLGTGTYLFWQTLFVIVWVTLNAVMVARAWDPYPFILLNLAFSTQAAYAAPLILLAQNRQDDRDRVALEEDRARASRTIAETEYLARELAGVRLAVGEVVTRDFLRSELERTGQSGDRSDRAGLDRAVQRAVDRAVDRAVERVAQRVVDHVTDRSLDDAVARALEQPASRPAGRDGTDTTDGRDAATRANGRDS